jgi:hypothetical protein
MSYKKNCKGVQIDVYDVLVAFNVANPAIQHAVKKLLCPGQRGAKNALQDLNEALVSIGRAIEIEESHSRERPEQDLDVAEGLGHLRPSYRL